MQWGVCNKYAMLKGWMAKGPTALVRPYEAFAKRASSRSKVLPMYSRCSVLEIHLRLAATEMSAIAKSSALGHVQNILKHLQTLWWCNLEVHAIAATSCVVMQLIIAANSSSPSHNHASTAVDLAIAPAIGHKWQDVAYIMHTRVHTHTTHYTTQDQQV